MDRVLNARRATIRGATTLLALLLACSAWAGDGAAVFATHCAECHSLKEGKDKKGPSLFGTLGKPAAGRTGFVYSEALRGSGLVWTAENLDAYLAAPARKVPGGKMKFDGLPSAAERADLIAYLASLGSR